MSTPSMSLTFTKLFSSITESTIWCEDSDTRVVWITMLAMADKNGRVWGAVPGIANRARVGVEVARAAIKKFLEPDADSRSNTYDPTTEGRRLEIIEGGWRLINHAHYRAIRDEEERRAYKADHERNRRERIRGQKRGQNGQTCTDVEPIGHNADADADAEKSNTTPEERELLVLEIARLYPKIADPWHLSREYAGVILDAIAIHGDQVLEGTKRFRASFERWPKEKLKFAPGVERFFRQSEYLFPSSNWDEIGTGVDGKWTPPQNAPPGYVPESVKRKKELAERKAQGL